MVPAEAHQFQPVADGDKICGRGAVDDLGNAVVAIETLRLMKDSPIGIGVIFTADEEIGGDTTAGMVELGYRATSLAVVLDGNANAIVCREKGMAIFQCTAGGIACHASTPVPGENPITKLMQGYCRLEAEFAKWPQMKDGDLWHLTMVPCIISGGDADNQVPASASMTINVRYTSTEELERFSIMLKEAMGDEKDIAVQIPRTCLPVFCDENNPVMQMMMEELRKAVPEAEPQFETMCGATDARHMTGWNVPIAITGVVGNGFHGVDEWVSSKSIAQYIQWLCSVIRRLDEEK